MQKTVASIVSLLFIINFSNCSQKINPEGSLQKTAVVADADLKEWSLPLRFGNKTGTIQYSITNDKENIYIALLSRDEATEEKILAMGMTVYFDPAGGESKAISMNYPLKSFGGTRPEGNNQQTSGGAMNANQKSRKQEMMLQSNAFTITGFQDIENRSYDVTDRDAIQVALKINDDNALVYEAAVPIKNILGRAMTVNDPKKNFTVGIIVKGIQLDNGSYNTVARNAGAGRGGARGMGGGRGMRGGGARPVTSGSTPDRAALMKDDVNWYKFRLAL